MCSDLVLQHFIVSEFNAYDKCYFHLQSTGLGSVALSSPGGTDGKLAFSTSWDAEKEFAAKNKKCDIRVFFGYLLGAKAHATWVRVDCVHGLALWALNIHEKGVWCLDKFLQFVQFLLEGWVIIKKIDLHCFFQIRC